MASWLVRALTQALRGRSSRKAVLELPKAPEGAPPAEAVWIGDK